MTQEIFGGFLARSLRVAYKQEYTLKANMVKLLFSSMLGRARIS